jgi:hypothetical protein
MRWAADTAADSWWCHAMRVCRVTHEISRDIEID